MWCELGGESAGSGGVALVAHVAHEHRTLGLRCMVLPWMLLGLLLSLATGLGVRMGLGLELLGLELGLVDVLSRLRGIGGVDV
jgi:hypothetical protein